MWGAEGWQGEGQADASEFDTAVGEIWECQIPWASSVLGNHANAHNFVDLTNPDVMRVDGYPIGDSPENCGHECRRE